MNPLETVDISTQHKSPQRPEAALLAELSCFQRLLLVTDGTVTEMLEQYLQESIQVHKLAEKVETDVDQLPAGHELFVSAQDMPVLKRQVLLRGKPRSSSGYMPSRAYCLIIYRRAFAAIYCIRANQSVAFGKSIKLKPIKSC